tara:strand:- start:73 stop:366 length:294 start_codon:yes stop_codon:yes gene_type:complete
MYEITKYSFDRAKKLGVFIKPAKSKNKKIDVYNKDGKKIASIGGVKKDGSFYKDYASILKTEGKAAAKKRRTLYKIRHERFRNIKGTNSYFADQILW